MDISIIYLVSLVLVCTTVLLIVRNFTLGESKRRNVELLRANKEKTLLIRLQAYERLILFLERLNPDQLLFRVIKKTTDKPILTQARILQSIREEYEHNLSQQIYVSSNAWELIKSAKEEVAKVVNVSISKVNPASTDSMGYMKAVLDTYNDLENNPIKMAIEYTKQEARKLY